jgi:hypothetical protein
MFIGSSIFDLKVAVILLVISFTIAFLVFVNVKSNKGISLLVFSLLSNLSIYLIILSDSRMFNYYNIEWLKFFSIFIWPFINIFLFLIISFNYLNNRNVRKRKN